MGDCEPCQAGNRAALSSLSCARSKSVHSYDRIYKQFFNWGETMAYQALYRKYRPQTFSDVVGQSHITETLKNELDTGKMVHAYLFTGTRGTGKTSCAKILAKAINCLNTVNGNPCGECEMCRAIARDEITDIVEIDAASNNGVDHIRELREQVNFSPAAAKYRVYIIDEVHMLSGAAFNALLKTLEEPPHHVVFILATTEVHKLPATILSRCQRFDFRRIDSSEICARLHKIALSEGLTLTDDAATLIASAADGGMRDALSILDLCASNNSNIDEDVVATVCSMAGNDYLIKMAELIRTRNTEQALLLIDKLHNSSVDMLRLLAELTNHFRDLMIVKTVKGDQKPIVCSAARLNDLKQQADAFDIKEIMCILSVLQSANAAMQNGNRRCEMEMAIIRLCNPEIRQDLNSLEMRVAALEKGSVKATVETQEISSPKPKTTKKTKTEIDESTPRNEQRNNKTAATTTKAEQENAVADELLPVAQWEDVLAVLQKSCPIIAGVLQGSNAYISGDRLLIDTQNSQFRTLVNGANNLYRDSIRKAAYSVLGTTYKLGPYRASEADVSEDDPLKNFAQRLKNLENN